MGGEGGPGGTRGAVVVLVAAGRGAEVGGASQAARRVGQRQGRR